VVLGILAGLGELADGPGEPVALSCNGVAHRHLMARALPLYQELSSNRSWVTIATRSEVISYGAERFVKTLRVVG
jgi:hypothetical protein